MAVKDEALRKMTDEVNRRLDSLYAKWMRHFDNETEERPISETARFWLWNEPTFAKPVAKPIHGRPPDKLPVYSEREPLCGPHCEVEVSTAPTSW
jgi:hypothetical protein